MFPATICFSYVAIVTHKSTAIEPKPPSLNYSSGRGIETVKSQRQFAKLYTSFVALEEDAVPLLSRNAIIFYNYGPANDDPHSEERHKMWLQFEPEIISNNRKLQLMLERNKHLFHKANRSLVDQFIAHAHEFTATRDDNPIKRILLFPEDFLSIFGMGAGR